MKRSEQYLWFNASLSSLLHWLVNERIPFRLGEAHRTAERAEQLAKEGKGIVNSKHVYSLAVDIWITDPSGLSILWKDQRYEKAGQYWKALGGVWGGDFKGKTAGDIYHFEISEKVSRL